MVWSRFWEWVGVVRLRMHWTCRQDMMMDVGHMLINAISWFVWSGLVVSKNVQALWHIEILS